MIAATPAPTPKAHFCAFDCSSSGRPSRPGQCFLAAEVFDTMGVDWLTLRLRDTKMNAGNRYVQKAWNDLTNSSMTWEAWFRLTSLPARTNTLMGTYGANHDNYGGPGSGDRVIYDDSTTNRRRYAAVAVDAKGTVSLSSNVGVSSGTVVHDISIGDGEWHHVAATFTPSGSAQIVISFRVLWIDYTMLMNRPFVMGNFTASMRVACASLANSEVEDVMVSVDNALVKPTPVDWEYAVRVTCEINIRPDMVLATVAELTSTERVANTTTSAANVTGILIVLQKDYFIQDITVRPAEVALPQVGDAGTMQLFVDGFLATTGWVNYAPRGENTGMDGEFVLCGGRVGLAMGCQVQHFRLWSQVISPDQLRAMWPCSFPSVAQVIGGPLPYGLLLSATLDGNFTDIAPSPAFALIMGGQQFEAVFVDKETWNPPEIVGKFVQGGRCHFPRCPAISPASTSRGTGCPLVPGSQVPFDSADVCEGHAALNFCRQAGSSRGRPAVSSLDGCHAGGSIASRGWPLSWRSSDYNMSQHVDFVA